MNAQTHLLAWLRLARAPGIGPALAAALLDWFGSPGAALDAGPTEIASVPGIGPKSTRALLDEAVAEVAQEEVERGRKEGISFISIDAPEYPPALRRLAQPPLVLTVRGELKLRDRLGVAIVGPRQPSDYARQMTRALIPPLCARGLTIVSGLAYGVDAEAHDAALACGGRTIAVLGQGLLTPLYPASNRRLRERIAREGQGALISAFPLEAAPRPQYYPRRNELIAALALGTLIVEAGERSGSLITARMAAEVGATVMACPGDATRPNARGSNALIGDGAAMIQSSDDVLEVLGPELRRALIELEREAAQENQAEDKTIGPEAGQSEVTESKEAPKPAGGDADAQNESHRPARWLSGREVAEILRGRGRWRGMVAGEPREDGGNAPGGEVSPEFAFGANPDREESGVGNSGPGRGRGRKSAGKAKRGRRKEDLDPEEYPLESNARLSEPPLPDEPLPRLLLERLSQEHRPLDYLLGEAAQEGFTQPEIVQVLLEMEMAGRVERLPGRVYRRKM